MNVDKICEVINTGGLVISKSDTIYGILADSLNDDAVRKVFTVKKRDYNKPLILLMDSIDMVKKYTSDISEVERQVMDKFWPGLITIVLKKNDNVSNFITSNGDTVAIRIPDDEDLLEIIRKLNRPVVSTSANITGTEVITNINMLEKDLVDLIDYIEDDGEIINKSSTIVKIDNGCLRVLREGVLSNKIRKYFEEK